jgi:ABC-type nickel/cobalt efflux system permease component RcnA
MLARARGWSRSRTLAVTIACGVGHVASSLVLGAVGLGLGLAVARIERIDGTRGDWAAWGLVVFGAAYALWGTRRALRRSRDIEPHTHGSHVHIHSHALGGHHDHEATDAKSDRAAADARGKVTFWTLFAVFILGPCEPLIPLFVLPASRGRWGVAATTAVLFGVITVATMTAITLAGLAGLERLSLRGLERWAHTMAGAVIALSGAAVLTLAL